MIGARKILCRSTLMKPKKLAELYQTPLLSGGVWARDYQSSQPSRILCESHAFDSQLTLLRIQPRFSRNSARVVLYPGIVVMEMRQYARCTCMAWLAISACVRTRMRICATRCVPTPRMAIPYCTSGAHIATFQCRRGASFQLSHQEQD